MLRVAALAGAVILSASCNRSESSDGLGPAPAAGSAKPGSGGGFSADLAKDLARSKPPDSKPDPAGSGDAKPTAVDTTKVAAADSKPADSKPADSKPTSDPKPAANDAKAAAGDAKPGDPSSAKPSAAVAAPPAPRGPVKVSTDLAAIKLSLLPNWDRDIDEPGTFQYVVRIKGTQNTKTFTFRYGYEDAKAPDDHVQYKKYLLDTHTLTGDVRDRQRGAAWFLEGNDSSGQPAFRYIVLYGGKRLICYGSLYKDAESNKLGDDRDQTLIQAKQICETLAL